MTTARRSFVSILSAVFFVGALCCVANASPVRYGYLSGTLQGLGKPLQGACVSLVSRGDTNNPAVAVSDRSGKFRLTVDLLAPNGNIGAESFGMLITPCKTTLDVAPEWWPHRNTFIDSGNVVVRPGRSTTVNVALRAGADVSGHVRLMPGVPTSLFCPTTGNINQQLLVATPNSSGAYAFRQLIPGTHVVSLAAACSSGGSLAVSYGKAGPGMHGATQSAPVTLRAGQHLNGVDFTVTF